MSDSPLQTVQKYFDELLHDVESNSKVNSKEAGRVDTEKKQKIAERVAPAKDRPKPPVVPARSRDAEEKMPSSLPVEKASPPPLVETQRQRPERPAVKPMLDEKETLREEQKTELQKLLNQRSLMNVQPQAAQPQANTPAPADAKLAKTAPPNTEAQTPVSEPALRTQVDEQVEPDALSDHTFHSTMMANPEWAENGRPQWAQERFDVLLLDVAGLSLAVPLISLGQIVPLTEELTPIFGQSDWFMGIFPAQERKLRVVNTALFVMPEKYHASLQENVGYAVSLDAVPWALAVDKINQPISLDPDEIKWRTERSKRPWLAGTVKSAMCALLDIPKMAEILNRSDPNYKQPPV